MPGAVASLFWIVLCAAAAPIVAGLVPRRLLPEVVVLLVAGVVIGPYVLGLAVVDEAIDMLRELGLGMLFLLAGYEIELRELTGRAGRRALVTWLACLALAFLMVTLVALTRTVSAEVAVAIALTSTSLGTLLPILRDSRAIGTRFGATVLRHGAYGELGPIVAMAVLLSTRGALASVLVLALFAALAVLATLPSAWVQRSESWLRRTISAGSETSAQTTVRLTLLLLVTLGMLAVAFELDVVLGAFAAGFILRRALPGGDERLESKLDGLAFGLLIPVFFVTSGMAIDPHAIASAPTTFVGFVLMIVLVRGLPVYLAVRTERDPGTKQPSVDGRDSLRVALYAATGLPIIVAVTSVAVSAGEMTGATASLLVAGGGVTVLLLPMTATLLARSEPERAQR